MILPLTETTAQALRAYLREIKTTHAEIGKRERFNSLLGTLFPNTREVGIYARGAETSLHIRTPEKEKSGRAGMMAEMGKVMEKVHLTTGLVRPVMTVYDNSCLSPGGSDARK